MAVLYDVDNKYGNSHWQEPHTVDFVGVSTRYMWHTRTCGASENPFADRFRKATTGTALLMTLILV